MTTGMAEDKRLFDEFSKVSGEESAERVIPGFKGTDPDKDLVWDTGEGFMLSPLYTREDLENLPFAFSLPGEFPYARGNSGAGNSWLIRQDINVTDFRDANHKALFLLDRGIDSLGFIIEDNVAVSGSNLALLLESIYTAGTEINFRYGGDNNILLGSVEEAAGIFAIPVSSFRGSLGADPLGRIVVTGRQEIPVYENLDKLARIIENASAFTKFRVIDINAACWRNAGSSVVQELALAMASGSEYLTGLTDSGVDVNSIAEKTGFTFATGSSYFKEIAKLRAARILWAHLVKAYGGSDKSGETFIHSVTSDWNKTVYDPYVNMLRTQTEVMSASLGGADSITTGAYDRYLREPGEFSERIARNQQLLLREEAYFGKVRDPGAGSYYIEKMTGAIVEKAWELFTTIEDKGGLLRCLESGYIQLLINENAEKERRDLGRGRKKLLGTNIYPDRGERLEKIIPAMEPILPGDTMMEPIKPGRLADEFERVRLATDLAMKIPKVFLLPVGDPAGAMVRAHFCGGFFSLAGYKLIENTLFRSPEEGAGLAISSGAEIIVVCGSDKEYPVIVPEIVKLAGDKALIVVAGGKDNEGILREAGIDIFIDQQSDIPTVLAKINRILGINQEERI